MKEWSRSRLLTASKSDKILTKSGQAIQNYFYQKAKLNARGWIDSSDFVRGKKVAKQVDLTYSKYFGYDQLPKKEARSNEQGRVNCYDTASRKGGSMGTSYILKRIKSEIIDTSSTKFEQQLNYRRKGDDRKIVNIKQFNKKSPKEKTGLKKKKIVQNRIIKIQERTQQKSSCIAEKEERSEKEENRSREEAIHNEEKIDHKEELEKIDTAEKLEAKINISQIETDKHTDKAQPEIDKDGQMVKQLNKKICQLLEKTEGFCLDESKIEKTEQHYQELNDHSADDIQKTLLLLENRVTDICKQAERLREEKCDLTKKVGAFEQQKQMLLEELQDIKSESLDHLN